ncbi:hypothetical protein [Nostocoides vanveenii]|uniref:Uncharacterized protein n=1 Tax=Nostocoides vanveenii TaxID=330835 RepID=A0ABP4WBF4_9MICO
MTMDSDPMASPTTEQLVARLRAILSVERLRAMKARDASARAATRAALAALDNAEAVPIESVPASGAIEASAIGVGAADVERGVLTWADARAVVEREIAEHEHAAHTFQRPGDRQDERAADLLRQAAVLREVLDRVEGSA